MCTHEIVKYITGFFYVGCNYPLIKALWTNFHDCNIQLFVLDMISDSKLAAFCHCVARSRPSSEVEVVAKLGSEIVSFIQIFLRCGEMGCMGFPYLD